MIEKLSVKNEKYLLDMVEQLKNETGEVIDVRVSNNKLKTAFLFSKGDEYLGFLVCYTKLVETSDGEKKIGVNEGVFVNNKDFIVNMLLLAKFEQWAFDRDCDYVMSRVVGEVENQYTYFTHTGYKMTKDDAFFIKKLDKRSLCLNR